jgi:glucose/arabinose dehydrogenase
VIILRSLLIGLALCAVMAHASAATLPAGFTETQISGLSDPTAMAIAPDGRIFVCLQGGSLRVIKNGALLPTPFVTVTVDATGERGLLGIAFDPDFATNNFLYVYYTVPAVASPPAPPHNRVSRFTANGDVAVAGSELHILNLENLNATNHNGGAIHFGPDGKLYVATGENAVPSNAQTLNNRLGKILRINTDGTIPTDNPFFNTASGVNRSIWALGLRNPFTFAFQPGTTRMFINDVGQNAVEEINDGIAGSNYGWPTCEGACSPAKPNFRDPLFQYGHGFSSTTGCAIAGGAFYNATTVQFPASYVGKYFFADLCSGWVRLMDPSNNSVTDFASGIPNPVDLAVASDGSLYYLARGSSSVFRVQFTGGTAPSITTHPANQTVAQGAPATFSVVASGSTPLSYQWQRNQQNISGATSSSYTLQSAAFADDGATFRCIVTNAVGSATSNEATLTVNAPPSITGHPSSQTVAEGQPATFSVTATGSATLSYQWQRNHQNISGATSSSYTLPSAAFPDNGATFRCIVTNAFGSATSNEATLTVNAPPSITGHPSSHTVAEGQPATFTVAATGSAALSYQWQRNHQNISGATSSSYTLQSAAFSDHGATFRCIVTNAFGSATSNEATLTVNAPPSITGHPSNQTVTTGQPATFSVAATGSATLSYQWQRDQANIPGATSSSYTISSASVSDNGAKFRCVVTNAFGSATSNEATLTLQSPPIIEAVQDSDNAIALTSPMALRDPFPLLDPFNLSPDTQTRVMLFVRNLNVVPGDDLTVRAEDAGMNVYQLTIEFAGKVPDFTEFTQVIVILPNNLSSGQDVLLSVTWHNQTSNKVRIRIQ